jgi:hypothetical protein
MQLCLAELTPQVLLQQTQRCCCWLPQQQLQLQLQLLLLRWHVVCLTGLLI